MAATLASSNLTTYGGAGPFDIDYPASIVSGDLILLTLGGICTGTGGFSTPSGFALVGSQQEDTFRFRTAIFARTATGSESGPIAVTQANASNGIATVSRITGHNGVDSGAVSNPASTEGSGTTVDSASVTITGSDQLVIIVAREAGPDSMTIVKPGSTNDSAGETSGFAAFNSSCYIASFTQASGATGAKTWTGMADSATRHGMTIAILTPASGLRRKGSLGLLGVGR